jgi:hypothetical protein
MSRKKAGDNSQDNQLARFAATARALGCDEDEAAFDEKLKAIARQKPKPVEAGESDSTPTPVVARGRRKRA